MTEEEVTDVNNQEFVEPEAISEEEGHDEQPKAEDQTPDEAPPAKGSKEYNLRRQGEKIEALERENYEMRQRLNPPKPVQEEEVDEEDLMTIGDYKKLKERERIEALPGLTRSKYNDFDEVMTPENIKKLENEEPDVAFACSKARNPWEATYKILTKMVLPKKDPKPDKADMKMKENLSKPVSSNSLGRSEPLQNANRWSEADKEVLRKEMEEYARKAL